MGPAKTSPLSRRDFLQLTALSIGAVGTAPFASAQSSGKSIAIVGDPADPVASSDPVRWAIQELSEALAHHGIHVRQFASLEESPREDVCIAASGRNAPLATSLLKQASVSIPNAPESLALASLKHKDKGRPILLACGSDARGLMYALLELADRVRHSSDPYKALQVRKPLTEQPFNQTRSIGRCFVSEIEDKPWFNDREMWPAYFSMLAAQRINRFSLNFGIGYDFLVNVTDAYFLFTYPFLLSVPDYNVRAVNLSDAERDKNLETLQFISQQAVAHGIDFQLGIWTHGYQWRDSPTASYTIEGLAAETHAAYSHDAMAALLRACPAISGVTMRTHGESGVAEGSYAFWKTVFGGVSQCGRKVEIDLHTKGLDQGMIDAALASGMPLRISPKYWAEHMGMPYQQAAIRELEMPREDANPQSFFALSSGSRSFTRYGYADFLRIAYFCGATRFQPRLMPAPSISAAATEWNSTSRLPSKAGGDQGSRAAAAPMPIPRSTPNGIGKNICTHTACGDGFSTILRPIPTSGAVICAPSFKPALLLWRRRWPAHLEFFRLSRQLICRPLPTRPMPPSSTPISLWSRPMTVPTAIHRLRKCSATSLRSTRSFFPA
jgi:hypothetical protein